MTKFVENRYPMKQTYTPRPAEVDGIELPATLSELTERMARNVHEVWAAGRIAQGWSYGPERSDERLEHPCLLPYDELPESEREYDRATAVGTLRLILSLGFDIVRKKE